MVVVVDHYLDLPILCTLADLKYYHSHSVDFFQIVLHLSDHMIIGCLTTEYTFVFIAIFSYLLMFHIFVCIKVCTTVCLNPVLISN